MNCSTASRARLSIEIVGELFEPCVRIFVFLFKADGKTKMLAGIGKTLTSYWRKSSMCDVRAALYRKSISRMRTEVTLVFARRRARSKQATLFDTTGDWKGLRGRSVQANGVVYVLVERGDHCKQAWRAANLL